MFKYAIVASVCCLTFGVNAETVLMRDYKVPKNEEFKAFNELYLAGVKEGLLTANAKLAMDGKPKLFCLPPKKEVTAQCTRQTPYLMLTTIRFLFCYSLASLILSPATSQRPQLERIQGAQNR